MMSRPLHWRIREWDQIMGDEFDKEYMAVLLAELIEERKETTVYPEPKYTFAAFNTTDFNDVKVVILGQDPYHGPNQAHGLAFSVQPEIVVPPSLENIFKELKSDLGINKPYNGYLLPWAERGVFLLNTTLTVEKGKPNSHSAWGWSTFTDRAIMELSERRNNLVFLLWGKNAISKANLIDTNKHQIFAAPHPSPLSAYRGFLGAKPFSKTNAYLRQHNIAPIDWSL